MSESKHTPGPWEMRGGSVTTVTGKALAAIDVWPNEGKTAIANARLIAAAPELLEACKEAARAFDQYGWLLNPGDMTFAHMLDAIDKATKRG